MKALVAELFFGLSGLFMLALGARLARDRAHPKRWGSALFWTLLGLTMALGKLLPPALVGGLLLVMTGLVGAGQVGAPRFDDALRPERAHEAARHGMRLLVPLMIVPCVAILGGFALAALKRAGLSSFSEAEANQLALGSGCVLAFLFAWAQTRAQPRHAVEEGGRLLQLLGWTLLLPTVLASLGGIFAKAEVGKLMAQYVAAALPVQHPLAAVLVYCAGMTAFTVLLGNAFAAFPLLTLGVGIPFIVEAHAGDPAVMGVLGMLAGYCGTLVTPMAANFNVVPARLLELRDPHAVIKAQLPFACAIWCFVTLLMATFVYR